MRNYWGYLVLMVGTVTNTACLNVSEGPSETISDPPTRTSQSNVVSPITTTQSPPSPNTDYWGPYGPIYNGGGDDQSNDNNNDDQANDDNDNSGGQVNPCSFSSTAPQGVLTVLKAYSPEYKPVIECPAQAAVLFVIPASYKQWFKVVDAGTKRFLYFQGYTDFVGETLVNVKIAVSANNYFTMNVRIRTTQARKLEPSLVDFYTSIPKGNSTTEKWMVKCPIGTIPNAVERDARNNDVGYCLVSSSLDQSEEGWGNDFDVYYYEISTSGELTVNITNNKGKALSCPLGSNMYTRSNTQSLAQTDDSSGNNVTLTKKDCKFSGAFMYLNQPLQLSFRATDKKVRFKTATLHSDYVRFKSPVAPVGYTP